MRTQEILLRKPQPLCNFQGDCTFKKPNNTRKNITNKHAVCTWEGTCNQQETTTLHRQTWNTTHDG